MIRIVSTPRRLARTLAGAAVGCALASCSGDGAGTPPQPGYRTAQPGLAVGMGGATVEPILTVGDTVGTFIYPPTPDGLGGYVEGGWLILFNSHETGLAGVPGEDGTAKFTHARVSRLVLDRATTTVLSGSLAVDAPAGYRNFCSATFATAHEGMPGGWFLTGEETTGAGKDGMQIAVGKSGQVVEMPWMGRFGHENTVAIPGFTGRVVLAGLDDTRGRSELYLYVAANEAGVLNGTGTLYVFTSTQAANVGQLSPGQGVDGSFVAIPNAASLSSAQLQAAVDGLGALRFGGSRTATTTGGRALPRPRCTSWTPARRLPLPPRRRGTRSVPSTGCSSTRRTPPRRGWCCWRARRVPPAAGRRPTTWGPARAR